MTATDLQRDGDGLEEGRPRIWSIPRRELLTLLRVEIHAKADWVTAAYLFGSAGREDMQADSDIDIALICPRHRLAQTRRVLEDLADLTNERFGNGIHGVVGARPIAELAKPGGPGFRLWRNVERDGIPIFPPRQRWLR